MASSESEPDSGPASIIVSAKRLCSSGLFDGLKSARQAFSVARLSREGVSKFPLLSDDNDIIDGLGGDDSGSDDIHGHEQRSFSLRLRDVKQL